MPDFLDLYSRDGTGQDFLDPTRPVNFKIIAGMGEVLKFMTLDGGLRKKNAKKFYVFLQKWLNFKTFFG